MKYAYDNEFLSFLYVQCFSMSRFWVWCHLLPLPLLFFVILLLATINGLAFPGSLDEAMMSGALRPESKSVRETSVPRLGSPKSVRHSG